MTTPIAYLNGQYLPIDRTNLHVFDMGIVGGVSVTEMARTFRHVPFRLDQHLDRLAESLDYVGFKIEQTTTELRAICDHVIEENARQIPDHHDLGVIVFVTAGSNPTYVGKKGSPTVCVHTFSLPYELWADSYQSGVHLVTVKTRSLPVDVIDPRIKHRSRLHWHLASREAARIDVHATAILSDKDDNLTETATGNLCVVAGPTIITPAANVLRGISREYVAELAASMGIEFVHAPVAVEDLSQADEAFLTSTPHCLLPVTRFNGSPIGSGRPGPLFQRLITAWGQSVQLDIIDQMSRGASDRSS